MILSLLIIVVLCFFSLRSTYLLIWRFNPEKKLFAWKHLLILVAVGFVSFSLVFFMALGSLGHHVPTDEEEMAANLTLGSMLANTGLCLVASVIAIVRGIRFRAIRAKKKE